MYLYSQADLTASRQAASISSYAVHAPSSSPSWDRGLLKYSSSSPPPAASLLNTSPSPLTMAQLVNQQMVIVPAGATPNGKDSRWLTLEVCREFQRSKCSRSDNECKFAHPPAHVEVQNGRVVACFDSIKGKCQRKEPPCKYLHPPQHLREQLLQNGRNNLILKNLQLQAYQQAQFGVLPVQTQVKQIPAGTKTLAVPTVIPGQYSYVTHYPGLQTLSAVQPQPQTTAYNHYITSLTMPPGGDPVMSPNMIPASAKTVRADKFESASDNGEPVTSHTSLMDTYSFPYIPQVCREFQRGTCSRATSECRYAHPAEHIVVDSTDNHVTVCMDFIKSKCTRELCKYFHPPSHLQALVRAAHARNQAATAAVTNNTSANSSALPTSAATLPHQLVFSKKRPRDPTDDLLLSSMPGMIPAYKRIAVGDLSKGGIPVYQANMMSPLQHTSLMQLQQPAPYIPMSCEYAMYTTLLYPTESSLPHHVQPPVLTSALGPSLMPSTSPSITTNSATSSSTMTGGHSIPATATPSSMFLQSNVNSSNSVVRLPSLPHNAYHVEYFGSNKQLRDTLPVCQDFKCGQCTSPYCKQVHLSEDYVEVNNGYVTVCRDYATRQSCKRSRCKYYHIPIDLPPS
ncbi:muscleblind-like protein 2a isoform X14 [Biomphalaria glabrata]|uniref:Muscleblind-like protein 2a isoform X14 n=1 Tax=Biomphalaria glabrata TaxID=6526 RepID=A0A9U8DZX0_BIOGL|nr:muscleblind-like protein 2a isoform X14 [Biomphalaria glabrata]